MQYLDIPFAVPTDSITPDQLTQLLTGLKPYTDKGMIVNTYDDGVTIVCPEANTFPQLQGCLWRRIIGPGSEVKLYVWNSQLPYEGVLPFRNWVDVTILGLALNSVGTYQLQDSAVTNAKIATGIDYNKLINTPIGFTPGGAAGGVLAGTYPNPSLGTAVITSNNIAENSINAGSISSGAILPSHCSALLKQSLLPTGCISMYYGTAAPAGWLLCDGSIINATYTALIALLGKNTTPDLRGQFIRGYDPTATVDPDGVSRAVGSLQSDGVKAHQHFIANGVAGVGYASPLTAANTLEQSAANGSNGAADYNLQGTATAATLGLTSSTGGTETRPKNVTLAFIIKT